MPDPDPQALWIDDESDRPSVVYEPCFWNGNNGNASTTTALSTSSSTTQAHQAPRLCNAGKGWLSVKSAEKVG